MKKLMVLAIGALCLIQSSLVMAADFSFTGNLGNDDEVQLFGFAVGSTSTVTLRTFSYAGGTNADGTVIPAGGFDPILALFDGSGNLIGGNDDGAGVPADPVTGASFDTLYVVELAPGNYTVAVSQFSNFANGPTLADGFSGSGTSGFVDFTGATRTSAWAFDILNVGRANLGPRPIAVPIPTISQWAALLLALALGISGFWMVNRRKTI